MPLYSGVAVSATYRAYVFIDGGTVRTHFDEIGLPWQNLRLSRLAIDAVNWTGNGWMGGGIHIARVLVYDAVLDGAQANDVTEWLDAQDRERDTHVRRGYLRADPRGRREQKAVDVQLAVDAITAAVDHLYDCAVFVIGDGDLAPAIEAVGAQGCLTAVCARMKATSEVLAKAADRVGYLVDDPKWYRGTDFWLNGEVPPPAR